MNARQRFLETLRFGQPDRPPYYDLPIRDEVLERWYKEGFPRGASVAELFGLDHWELFGPREDVSLNLYMNKPFKGRLRTRADFRRLQRSYDPSDPQRYPPDWDEHVRRWKERDYPLGITAWRGWFQSLAVGDWSSLLDVLYLIYDDPKLLDEMTAFITDFTLAVIERALREVQFDYAVFDEPIASNHAPVISPQHFRRFLLPAYRRIIERLREAGIEIFIWDTHGHVGPLLPVCLEAGINCLWSGDSKVSSTDYVKLRARYGRRLALIGGIDLRVLYQDEAAIRAEIEATVPPLLASGGYVPMVDGRLRRGVPYRNYVLYRTLIQELVAAQAAVDDDAASLRGGKE